MTSISTGADPIRAFAIRGYLGAVFSRGMDALAARLRAAGIAASVHAEAGFLGWPYGNVPAIAAEAVQAARRGKRIVLIGHSMGGDAALKVAVRLAADRIAVPLLVCFDPTRFGAPPVPANVGRAICFYQSIGPIGGGRLVAGTGFAGSLVQERHNMLHSRLDDAPALHARVLGEVAKLGSGA